MSYIIIDSIFSAIQTELLWQIVGGIAGLIGLYFVYKQLHQQKIIEAFRFIKEQRENFYADKICFEKAQFAKVKLRYGNDALLIDKYAESVCDALEFFGLLCKQKVIPDYIMWSEFAYEILHWWPILADSIKRIRERDNDQSLYIEFEFLYNRILRFETNYQSSITHSLPTEADLKDFLVSEMGINYNQKVKKSDLITLTEIDRLSFNKYDKYNLADFRDLYNNHSEGFYKILYCNVEIIGYYAFYLESSDVCYIDSIAIEPSFRRLGIASEIIKLIVFRAMELGCKKVRQHVDVNNLVAIAFYESCEFKTIYMESKYYDSGNDAAIMEYEISSSKQ